MVAFVILILCVMGTKYSPSTAGHCSDNTQSSLFCLFLSVAEQPLLWVCPIPGTFALALWSSSQACLCLWELQVCACRSQAAGAVACSGERDRPCATSCWRGTAVLGIAPAPERYGMPSGTVPGWQPAQGSSPWQQEQTEHIRKSHFGTTSSVHAYFQGAFLKVSHNRGYPS